MAGAQEPGRIHFFWVLDGPALPLPEGWTCRRVLSDDGVIEQSSAVESDLDGMLLPDLVAQVRFTRILRPSGYFTDAATVAASILPGNDNGSLNRPSWAIDLTKRSAPASSGGSSSNDAGLLYETTIAHVTAAVPETPDLDAVAAAFEEGVDLVHTTHQALHAAFGLSLVLPTPESAPMDVAVALEVLTPSGPQPVWPIGGFMLGDSHFEATEEIPPTALPALAAAELEVSIRRPKTMVFDLRRAALAAARRTGDARTAVVMAAAACETLVDLTLAAVVWEEGMTPEEGAEELNRYRTITERVSRQLAPKLGGSWDVNKDDAYRGWRDLVASSRNRVIHAGDIPRPHLAHEVCDAMFAFFRFLLDRLCAPRTRNRYPMTCLVVGSRSVLEARGGWSKKMKAAATEADELDLQGVFGRWHSAMAELRLPQDQQPRPASQGAITLVVTASGRKYWVEHHARYRLARKVEPTSDVSEHIKYVDAMERVGIYVTFDEPPSAHAVGPWLPEHRLIPGIAVMRDPAQWYEPPG